MKSIVTAVLYVAFAVLFVTVLIMKNAYLIVGGFLLAAIYYWIVFVVNRKKSNNC